MTMCVGAEKTARPEKKVQAEVDAAMAAYDTSGNGKLEFSE